MGKKLTTLCELQLYSILQEIESSSADTSSAVTNAMLSCYDLENIIAVCGRETPGKQQSLEASVAAIKRELNNVVISMQSHDELSQRVSHVLQLFVMMKNEIPARTGELDDNGEILKIASRIFSIQSEFAVLNKLFPGSMALAGAGDTELF